MRGERDTPGKLFVSGIPTDFEEKELELAFAKYGHINEVLIVKDKMSGTSKGFGFLTFDIPEDADDAMKGMSGMDLGGQKIRVEHAVSRQSRDRDGFRGGRGGFRGGRGGRGDSRGMSMRDSRAPYSRDSRGGRGGSRGGYGGMRDSRDSRGSGGRDYRDSRQSRGFDEGRSSDRSGGLGGGYRDSYSSRSPPREDRYGSSGGSEYRTQSSRDYGSSGREPSRESYGAPSRDSYGGDRDYNTSRDSYSGGSRDYGGSTRDSYSTSREGYGASRDSYSYSQDSGRDYGGSRDYSNGGRSAGYSSSSSRGYESSRGDYSSPPASRDYGDSGRDTYDSYSTNRGYDSGSRGLPLSRSGSGALDSRMSDSPPRGYSRPVTSGPREDDRRRPLMGREHEHPTKRMRDDEFSRGRDGSMYDSASSRSFGSMRSGSPPSRGRGGMHGGFSHGRSGPQRY